MCTAHFFFCTHGEIVIVPKKAKVLLIHPGRDIPDGLKQAVEHLDAIWSNSDAEQIDAALADMDTFDAVVLVLEKMEELKSDQVRHLLTRLNQLSMQALVLAEEISGKNRDMKPAENIVWAGRNESAEMLKGRLATMLQMRPRVQRMADEMS